MIITGLVARAGRAFVAAKGKDPAVEGQALAEWLRSGAEIGPDEREMLAELVTGEWRARKGRPERKGPGTVYAMMLVADLEGRLKSYGPRRSLAAKQDTAKRFGESVRTVERYKQDADERARMIEDRAK